MPAPATPLPLVTSAPLASTNVLAILDHLSSAIPAAAPVQPSACLPANSHLPWQTLSLDKNHKSVSLVPPLLATHLPIPELPHPDLCRPNAPPAHSVRYPPPALFPVLSPRLLLDPYRKKSLLSPQIASAAPLAQPSMPSPSAPPRSSPPLGASL